ncbi:hypothetical protein Tco_0932383 [Tanacetum coccineum]
MSGAQEQQMGFANQVISKGILSATTTTVNRHISRNCTLNPSFHTELDTSIIRFAEAKLRRWGHSKWTTVQADDCEIAFDSDVEQAPPAHRLLFIAHLIICSITVYIDERAGEKGFEQTKKCYLTEVIPFFKTLKEYFKGIQKALTKEIKEMKDVFEELEAEVDQNVVDRKHDEIEQKKPSYYT